MKLKLIFGLLLFPQFALAQNYKAWASADLYRKGNALIEKGKNLQTSLAMLTTLVARSPDNADYHLALGCANVARLSSWTYAKESAEMDTAVKGMSRRRLKIWLKMQDNPSLPLYGTPRPPEPPLPATPDDEKVFDPAQAGTTETIKNLARQALFHLREAYRFSRALPLEKRAEIDYGCGWAMLQIYRDASDLVHFKATPLEITEKTRARTEEEKKSAQKEDDLRLEQTEIIDLFRECTVFNKKKADYWSSLALAYAPTFLTAPSGTASSSEEMQQFTEVSKQDNIKEADKCLRSALSLKRDDADLLYQLALLNRNANPERAIKDLTRLISVKNNAVLSYQLAQLHFQRKEQSREDKAIEEQEAALIALEKGNSASDYSIVSLTLPVIGRMKTSWNYRSFYGLGEDYRCLGEIADYLREIEQECRKRNETEMMTRVAVLEIEAGANALKHYVGNDLDPAKPMTQIYLQMRASNGLSLEWRGYNLVQEIGKNSPTEAHLALANRYANLEPYIQAWRDALTAR